MYPYRPILEPWVQITEPDGWTDAKTDTLVAILDAQPDYDAVPASSS